MNRVLSVKYSEGGASRLLSSVLTQLRLRELLACLGLWVLLTGPEWAASEPVDPGNMATLTRTTGNSAPDTITQVERRSNGTASKATVEEAGGAVDGAAQGIVVLGDSISAAYGLKTSEGWVSLLGQRLREQGFRYRLVNASITGDTSHGGLARLPALLKREQPDLVIIELGGNDGLRALSLKAMHDNLRSMALRIRESGARVLLLGMRIPANYGEHYSTAFHKVYLQLAQELKLPLVEFLLDGVALDTRLMQADGIHPNASAQPRLLENVWPLLRPLLQASQPTFPRYGG